MTSLNSRGSELSDQHNADDNECPQQLQPRFRNLGKQGRARLKRRRAREAEVLVPVSKPVPVHTRIAPLCIDVTSRTLTAKYDRALQEIRRLEKTLAELCGRVLQVESSYADLLPKARGVKHFTVSTPPETPRQQQKRSSEAKPTEALDHAATDPLQCRLCRTTFPSRNQIFRHLEKECLQGQLTRTGADDRSHRRRWKKRARQQKAQQEKPQGDRQVAGGRAQEEVPKKALRPATKEDLHPGRVLWFNGGDWQKEVVVTSFKPEDGIFTHKFKEMEKIGSALGPAMPICRIGEFLVRPE